MKNLHIVLLNTLFISSIVFAANPSANPIVPRIIKKNGHFDNCFDSPWEFSKCAGKGTVVAATGVGVVALGGGVIITAYGAVSSGIAAGSAAYAAGAGLGGIASASATAAGVGGATATAATVKGTIDVARHVGSAVHSAFSSPEPAPQPVLTPQEAVEDAGYLRKALLEERIAREQAERKNDKKLTATAVGAAVIGYAATRMNDNVLDKISSDIYDYSTGKKAERQKELEEEREYRCRIAEYNFQLMSKIDRANENMEKIFLCPDRE